MDSSGVRVGHHITVNGRDKVNSPPDTARITIGVNITKATAKVARAAGPAAMTSVVAAIKAAGIPPSQMRTSSLNLSPSVDYKQGPRVVG
jgi:uncharacterized protein YggE